MPSRRGLENSVNYPAVSLAKRVLQLFREGLDEKLRPRGVTGAQLHVLAKLANDPGISGAKLARACSVTPQTTQVLLRGIEANGWIVRRKHPENERILLATLTPAGKRQLAYGKVAVGRLYTRMLAGFSAKDAELLDGLLSRCVTNLESNPKPVSQTTREKAKPRPTFF
jgi:DNA-binding MarR family transcriptional regulator